MQGAFRSPLFFSVGTFRWHIPEKVGIFEKNPSSAGNVRTQKNGLNASNFASKPFYIWSR